MTMRLKNHLSSKKLFFVVLLCSVVTKGSYLHAQSIDARYSCQGTSVIDSRKGTAVNVAKLLRTTTLKITTLSRRISSIRGTSKSAKAQRAKLVAQRATLRAFVGNVRACQRGTFVPPATATPSNGVNPGATPTPVPTPTHTPTPGVRRPLISAGDDHACALSASGLLRCFGDNSFGQLGLGETPSNSASPVAPVGLGATSFASVGSGNGHTCAAPLSGGVVCWGSNLNTQLGDGTVVTTKTPLVVPNLNGQFVQAAAGNRHSCAVLADGSVVCWGQNNSGESGNGIFSTTAAPGNVQGLATSVTKISTFSRHTCAVLGNGGVQCWGLNAQGQLGLGGNNFNPSSSAISPNNLRPGISIVDVAPGADHTCVLYVDGVVQCVGQNDVGQMGIGSLSNQQMVFASVPLPGVNAIAAGDDFTCAVVNNRSGVSCWGKGLNGQLGNGANSNSSSPVSVQGLSGVITDLEVGERFACAVSDDTTVRCWGDNSSRQLGSTAGSSAVAVEVAGLLLNN